MGYVNNMAGEMKPMEIGDAAKAIVIKISGGWIFITHEGEMIGPDPDRESVIAKAALYLSAFKGKHK